MNLILIRNKFMLYGIMGELTDVAGGIICVTLEHAYAQADNSYLPKLPCGDYNCYRGEHRLHNLIPFTTFEITGVPECTRILFHKGNTNKDSEGCVLLGTTKDALGIADSHDAFDKFMSLQSGVDHFVLTVKQAI